MFYETMFNFVFQFLLLYKYKTLCSKKIHNQKPFSYSKLMFLRLEFESFYGSMMEKEMATHSSVLAWRIPAAAWVHEGGLQDHDIFC